MTRRHPSSPTPCPPLLPSCHAIVWLASLPNPGRNRGRMDFDLRTVFLLLAVIGTFTGKAYGRAPSIPRSLRNGWDTRNPKARNHAVGALAAIKPFESSTAGPVGTPFRAPGRCANRSRASLDATRDNPAIVRPIPHSCHLQKIAHLCCTMKLARGASSPKRQFPAPERAVSPLL